MGDKLDLKTINEEILLKRVMDCIICFIILPVIVIVISLIYATSTILSHLIILTIHFLSKL